MIDLPDGLNLTPPNFIPSRYDHHIQRRLSNMRGQYLDRDSYQAMLAQGDVLLYEVYEIKRPAVAGELLHGISIIHPGKVGDEYYMTKGHFHTVLDTAEIYYTLKGRGYMIMETLEGDCAVKELAAGQVLYVQPRWAHRSVNVSPAEDLVMFFVYPGNAGHDYGSIEAQGFRRLIIERNGQPAIVDNPRWVAPSDR